MVDETKPLPSPEQLEIEKLKAEVAALKAAPPAPPTGAAARSGGWWRGPVVTVMILIAAILAPLSVVSNWTNDMVRDTDRYVDTVAPLAENPAVQKAIARRVTNEIVAQINVEAVTDQAVDALTDQGLNPALAQSLSFLTTPVTNGITNFINKQVTKVVESDSFASAWEAANREAHTQLVAVLTGKDSDTVKVDQGTVTIDLAAIIGTVQQALVDQGFELAAKIPEVHAQFPIVQSEDLSTAQTAVRLLNSVAKLLPWLVLGLFIGAIAISRRRNRTAVAGALAIAASMVLLGAALNIGRGIYLDALPSDVNPSVAGIAFDQLVLFIREALRAVLALALAVALIAWLTGSSGSAAGVRRGSRSALDAVRDRRNGAGLHTGPIGVWAYTYRVAIRVGVLGAAFMIYILADHPTGALVIWLAVIAGIVLLLVELVAARPVAAATSEESTPEGPA